MGGSVNTSWSGTRESFPRPLRRAILQRDPICRHCHTRQSTIADHIIPVAEGGTDTITNGQGLCDPCHHTKTQAEARRGQARRRSRGQLPPTPHPGLI
jgi:5-methylcytosine-specific restriction protein A